MRAPVREALAEFGGVATVEELVGAGVSLSAVRWAVRLGDVVRVSPGTVADAATWQGLGAADRHVLQVGVALRRQRSGAVAAAASAAVVWGLPLEAGPPTVPVLVRPRGRDRGENGERTASAVRRRAWVAQDEIREVGGVRVTSLARTAVDVARSEEVPWALAVVDAVVRRGVTRDDLLDSIQRHARAPGNRQATQVVTWADGRAESALESVARGVVLMLDLPCPDLQVPVTAGGRQYRVDLLIREFRTVIEVDGKVKYTGAEADPEQSWQDKVRRDHLLESGHEIERFTASGVRQGGVR